MLWSKLCPTFSDPAIVIRTSGSCSSNARSRCSPFEETQAKGNEQATDERGQDDQRGADEQAGENRRGDACRCRPEEKLRRTHSEMSTLDHPLE